MARLKPDGNAYLGPNAGIQPIPYLHGYHSSKEAQCVRNIYTDYFVGPHGSILWQQHQATPDELNVYLLYILLNVTVCRSAKSVASNWETGLQGCINISCLCCTTCPTVEGGTDPVLQMFNITTESTNNLL